MVTTETRPKLAARRRAISLPIMPVKMYQGWMSTHAPCHLVVFALISSGHLPYRAKK